MTYNTLLSFLNWEYGKEYFNLKSVVVSVEKKTMIVYYIIKVSYDRINKTVFFTIHTLPHVGGPNNDVIIMDSIIYDVVNKLKTFGTLPHGIQLKFITKEDKTL